MQFKIKDVLSLNLGQTYGTLRLNLPVTRGLNSLLLLLEHNEIFNLFQKEKFFADKILSNEVH